MNHIDDDPTLVRPADAPGPPSGAPSPGPPSGAPLPPPAPGLRATLRRDFRIGLKAGPQTFWELARVMTSGRQSPA